MNDHEILLHALRGMVSGQERTAAYEALQRIVATEQRRNKILSAVSDALGQLRLDMKYLIFDLESTRRERDELIRKLEE